MTFWLYLLPTLAVMGAAVLALIQRERVHFQPEKLAAQANGDPLSVLEVYALDLARRARYSDRNRTALLAVHGVGGMLTTVLIFADTTAAAVLEAFGSLATPFNVLPAIGGTLLMVGMLLNRYLPIEAAGMILLLLWDLGMCWAFTSSTDDATTLYPLSIYSTLGGLLFVHLATLLSMALEAGRRP